MTIIKAGPATDKTDAKNRKLMNKLGKKARKEGKSVNECPYQSNCLAGGWWIEGWTEEDKMFSYLSKIKEGK